MNTYYPGTANVAKGATSIPLGTANGRGRHDRERQPAAGDPDAGCQHQHLRTPSAMETGSTGSGFTAINNAGNYEFVTATGPIARRESVPIKGAGPTNGLVFAYTAAAASATKGRSTYQVVLVPQYLSATLGAVTATSWNGSTGGIRRAGYRGTAESGWRRR